MSSKDLSRPVVITKVSIRQRRKVVWERGPIEYKYEELVAAYLAWVKTPMDRIFDRLSKWDTYVDVRDGYPIGTTKMGRLYGLYQADQR